jgi:hypothetical protein
VHRTSRRFGALLAAALVASAASAPATVHGQPQRGERPYRGLFGGNEADPNSRQSLNLNFSLYGGYDENVAADAGATSIDPRFQQSSSIAGADLAINYARRLQRFTMNANAGGSYRYYPDTELKSRPTYQGAVGFGAELSRLTQLQGNISAGYAPYYTLRLLPGTGNLGELPIPSAEVGVVEQESLQYSSYFGLGRKLSRRSTIDAYYSHQWSDYMSADAPSLRNQSAGARFMRRLNDNLGVRVGYGYRWGNYGSADDSRWTNDLDIGVDYGAAIDLSKRSRLSFSVGSSVIVRDDASSVESVEDERYHHFFGSGSLNFTREIGQSWDFIASYGRSFQYVPGFAEPFFSDGLTTSLEGMAGPRIKLSFSGAFSLGRVGYSTEDGNSYDTHTAAARLQYAISRNTALYVNYFYYFYVFDDAVIIPLDFARETDRHGVRGGFSLWLPLLR